MRESDQVTELVLDIGINGERIVLVVVAGLRVVEPLVVELRVVEPLAQLEPLVQLEHFYSTVEHFG